MMSAMTNAPDQESRADVVSNIHVLAVLVVLDIHLKKELNVNSEQHGKNMCMT